MSKQLLCLSLACAFALPACGTRDYPPAPPERTPQTPAPAPAPPPPKPNEPRPDPGSATSTAVAPKPKKAGYLMNGMKWIGVPDDRVQHVKCMFADSAVVSPAKAFGTTIIAGGILGIILRASGGWVLGRPLNSDGASTFWDKFDLSVNTVRQGFVRGAVAAATCETLLAGGNFTPLTGVLGQEMTALSTAIVIGGLSSLAAAPHVLTTMRERENDTQWMGGSKIVRGFRYRVAPNLVIVGVGWGIGVLVYDNLQNGEDTWPSGREHGTYSLNSDCE